MLYNDQFLSITNPYESLNWFLSKKLCDLYKYCIIHKISVITFPEIFDGTFSFAW